MAAKADGSLVDQFTRALAAGPLTREAADALAQAATSAAADRTVRTETKIASLRALDAEIHLRGQALEMAEELVRSKHEQWRDVEAAVEKMQQQHAHLEESTAVLPGIRAELDKLTVDRDDVARQLADLQQEAVQAMRRLSAVWRGTPGVVLHTTSLQAAKNCKREGQYMAHTITNTTVFPPAGGNLVLQSGVSARPVHLTSNGVGSGQGNDPTNHAFAKEGVALVLQESKVTLPAFGLNGHTPSVDMMATGKATRAGYEMPCGNLLLPSNHILG